MDSRTGTFAVSFEMKVRRHLYNYMCGSELSLKYQHYWGTLNVAYVWQVSSFLFLETDILEIDEFSSLVLVLHSCINAPRGVYSKSYFYDARGIENLVDCKLCKIIFWGRREVGEEERSLAQKLANLLTCFFPSLSVPSVLFALLASKVKGEDFVLVCPWSTISCSSFA